MVIVHGHEGIGKTRTVAEFARAAEAEAATVLWGTCYQGGVTYALAQRENGPHQCALAERALDAQLAVGGAHAVGQSAES